VLTGRHAFIGATEIIGYYGCKGTDNPMNCRLYIAGYLPWAGGWFATSAPDMYGLGQSNNWSNVNGTIYGFGNGSQAIFTNVEVETVLHAYSCFGNPQGPSGYFPTVGTSCAGVPLDATVTVPVSVTQETNNLTKFTVQPTGACQGSECWLSYRSSPP
jgi:hypothetical protein